MNSVTCKEVGGYCDFRASGESTQEIKEKFFDHLKEKHITHLAKMGPDDINHLNQKIIALVGDI